MAAHRQEPESALAFPCLFPVKAMGSNVEEFGAHVRAIIGRHVVAADVASVSERESRGGRYLAVTVTVRARSRAQLDAIYRDLSADPRIAFAL
jgi:putative lipoic acid-binding regulatory protein